MDITLTPKAIKEMEQRNRLERESSEILKVVVSEWQSDPMSVQCFDLTLVARAKEVVARLDKMAPGY